jgi:hypothetical protein
MWSAKRVFLDCKSFIIYLYFIYILYILLLPIDTDMSALLLILAGYLSVFGLIGYVLFCADTRATGVHGFCSRFFHDEVPEVAQMVIRTLFGQQTLTFCSRIGNYVMHERNPILQIGYLCILNGTYLTWLLYGAPQLPTRFVGVVHNYLAFLGVVACHATFYFACFTPPGKLTPDTELCFAHTPCDGVVYIAGTTCQTCNVRKVRPQRFPCPFS